jgi:threonine synthase
MSCATLREPYRIEGKKTMGLELAEQLDWQLPDAIFYPTGGGTGLIGMWKAFAEMEALGWIDARRPRMYAIQASGCAPIVRAFDEGAMFARRWEHAHTIAHGIRVPAALGDFLILQAVRESGGAALAVDDAAIETAWRDCGQRDGFLMCPEGAATLAGLRLAVERRLVVRGERVMLFNCATPYKYPLPA